jgi:hypothetical protein
VSIGSKHLPYNRSHRSPLGHITAEARGSTYSNRHLPRALCSLFLILTLAARGSNSSVIFTYKPPLIPVTFSIDSHGHISVGLGKSITGLLGTFSIEYGISVPAKSNLMLVSIIRTVGGLQQKTVYEIHEYGSMALCISGQVMENISQHSVIVTPIYTPSQIDLLPGSAPECSFPPPEPTSASPSPQPIPVESTLITDKQ